MSLSDTSVPVCGRTKIRSRDSQAFSCTQTTLPGTSFPKTGQSPRITFLSILPCTCDSVNAKQNCRPCAYTHLHTFTVSIVCSSLSLSCRVRTQTASLMHRAQFLFLQAVRETVNNHSPTDCTSFHHSPPPLLIPQQSVWGRDPTMLCNIILTVNFVRSGLFPTGHVSLTWEHRVFVPSAEGSPEKRRACHTHHWNLLSLWPNTAGHLRVTPHPFAYRAHSASPQPRRQHPTRPTSVSQTTMHGQPHPSQAKFRAASYLVHHQPRRPRFRSDRALGLNPCLPPVCPHGR